MDYNIKKSIANCEERIASYKKIIEDVSRDKINFPPEDELTQWFKSDLRDSKNTEERIYKALVLERRYENEGLNPPSCYKFR